jgi:DNA repair exonuclease SbcCD ATPase subunit
MASEYDPAEFVDSDFQLARKAGHASGHAAGQVASQQPASPFATVANRAPTREEIETRVTDMQSKLADLKRAQQELERERADLEETRRRQAEFTKGRQEMEQHLTRGIGLLEESEFAARRDAEQMSKSLVDLRESLIKVQSVHEESWTKDNLNAELTRALTTIENARMEWNSARLKFPILTTEPGDAALPAAGAAAAPGQDSLGQNLLREKSYAELCKVGLALTWPIALAGLAIFIVLLLR